MAGPPDPRPRLQRPGRARMGRAGPGRSTWITTTIGGSSSSPAGRTVSVRLGLARGRLGMGGGLAQARRRERAPMSRSQAPKKKAGGQVSARFRVASAKRRQGGAADRLARPGRGWGYWLDIVDLNPSPNQQPNASQNRQRDALEKQLDALEKWLGWPPTHLQWAAQLHARDCAMTHNTARSGFPTSTDAKEATPVAISAAF